LYYNFYIFVQQTRRQTFLENEWQQAFHTTLSEFRASEGCKLNKMLHLFPWQ
jgi:hypothetical protein